MLIILLLLVGFMFSLMYVDEIILAFDNLQYKVKTHVGEITKEDPLGIGYPPFVVEFLFKNSVRNYIWQIMIFWPIALVFYFCCLLYVRYLDEG